MLLDSDSSAQIPECIQSQLAPTKTSYVALMLMWPFLNDVLVQFSYGFGAPVLAFNATSRTYSNLKTPGVVSSQASCIDPGDDILYLTSSSVTCTRSVSPSSIVVRLL
jgi:hypothetical protein